MNKANDQGTERHTKTLHNIRLGIRYHSMRQSSYEWWHRQTGVWSLIMSSAAVATLTSDLPPSVGIVCASAVSIMQAFDLIRDNRGMALLHSDLRRRYLPLEPDLIHKTILSDNEYQDIQQQIKVIEMDEPSVIKRVMNRCHNTTLHVSGYTENDDVVFARNWIQKLFRTKLS